MALSKQQEALLKLKLQNDPEFQTGFYKSAPTIEQMRFSDLSKTPVGPLRYVDQVPGSESIFDEGDFDIDAYKVPTTAGPLRSIDPGRTAGIIQALEAKDPTGELVKNYVKSIEMTDDGIFQKVDQNPIPTKFAEFQPVPDSEIQKKLTTPVYNINPTSKAGVYGYTPSSVDPEKYGTEFIDKSKPVYLSQNLTDFLTTKPMSPANQLPVFTSQAAMLGMYGSKPEDIMRKAIDTVQHEYAHNITKFPQFKNIIKDAVDIGIPSDLKLKGKPGDALSIRDLEELFTRAIDIERVYRKTGDINDSIVDLDLQYIQSVLDKKYKKDKNAPYDYSSAISYINAIRPTVVNYFDKIEEIVKDQSLPIPKTPRKPTTPRPIAPTTGDGGSPSQMVKTAAAETKKKDLQQMRGPIGRDDGPSKSTTSTKSTPTNVGNPFGYQKGGRVGYALGSPEPLAIDDREKTIAFDLFQRLKDIEEQYTGERIVGDPSPLNLDPSNKRQGTLVADATTEMDQAPDSFLRPKRYDMINLKELPAETLDDFDVMFRKPNATGGRVKLGSGSGVIDYGKKYLKYKDRPTQEKLNKIIDDLTAGGAMTPDSALDLALKQIREE